MDPRYYVGGRHFHEGLGWGGWLLWVLFMIALWALVIMAVVWLVRSFTHRGSMTAQRPAQAYGGTGTVSAEQILAERFAHGQIDENEYRARLGVLRGDRPMAAQAAPPASPASPAPPPTPPTPPTPPAPPPAAPQQPPPPPE